MAQVNLKNSHYLNEKNRIIPQKTQEDWQDRDADYNIKSGLTFGETEDRTLENQGWKGMD